MGFQQSDPTTDFRGGGILSLLLLVLYISQYPQEWLADIAEEEKTGYLPAATSINVSFWLSVQCGLRESAQEEHKKNRQCNVSGVGVRRSRMRHRAFRSQLARYRLVTFILYGNERRRQDVAKREQREKKRQEAKRNTKEKHHKKKGKSTAETRVAHLEPLYESNTSRPPRSRSASGLAGEEEDQGSSGNFPTTSSSQGDGMECGAAGAEAMDGTPLLRLSLLHAAYMHRVRRSWQSRPVKNLMEFNVVLESVYEEMECWWVRKGGALRPNPHERVEDFLDEQIF